MLSASYKQVVPGPSHRAPRLPPTPSFRSNQQTVTALLRPDAVGSLGSPVVCQGATDFSYWRLVLTRETVSTVSTTGVSRRSRLNAVEPA